MTTDAPPPTRRGFRDGGEGETDARPADDDAFAPVLTDAADAADVPVAVAAGTLVVQHPADPPVAAGARGPIALAWLDETRVTLPAPGAEPEPAPTPDGADLLAGGARRSPWRPGVLVPVGLILAVVAAYAGTTLLWPLYAVAPRVEAVAVTSVSAAPAAPAWPADGSAAVSVAGIAGSPSSTPDASSIASITKVVTALMVLDRMPLAAGEAGPDFAFTAADRTRYWQYRSNGESALDVPVGGSLSEYQMLEGMLIGSANNYADRLAGNLWPSDAVFADAARSWLSTHGVTGVTIVDPTGIEAGNTASPEALLTLAARAMANPIVAEIVAKQSVELPGAGVVTNTNPLLVDPGMIGIKTGSLAAFNLLSAKDLPIGDTTVRLYAAVLGQPSPNVRDDATRALFAQIEQELQQSPVIPAGTVGGQVVTAWADPIDVVTSADASVLLWNGASATSAPTFALGEAAAEGDTVGTLTVSGPLNTASVDLRLADEVEGPSAWWRLTHPLDLFGLNG